MVHQLNQKSDELKINFEKNKLCLSYDIKDESSNCEENRNRANEELKNNSFLDNSTDKQIKFKFHDHNMEKVSSTDSKQVIDRLIEFSDTDTKKTIGISKLKKQFDIRSKNQGVSLTDCESNESSLDSDSYNTQNIDCTVSWTDLNSANGAVFLPISLLKDIRNRKTNVNEGNIYWTETKLANEKFMLVEKKPTKSDERSMTTVNFNFKKTIVTSDLFDKLMEKKNVQYQIKSAFKNRTSFLKTHLNKNHLPFSYECDEFYNFHVNEAATVSQILNTNLQEEKLKIIRDENFAGYEDIHYTTSTIRSTKGTVRGVKNRVKNGIATFLQMEQPKQRNFQKMDFGKVVVYTTSLGIIRETYTKCFTMRQILRTLLIKFEERDVFMSLEYQQEIKERLKTNKIEVPQLFVEGQYFGDVERVEKLNETGELRTLLQNYKSTDIINICAICGGYRLLPCTSCNGSKKSLHRNNFTAGFIALKCMNCDEAGLVKCHNC